LRIRGSTKVCWILGYPLKHSLSPLMHNAAFSVLGMDYVYVPFEVSPGGLASAIEALRRMENFVGANVTVPHKIQAMKYLDGWDFEAEQIGAVNTLFKKEGRLWGGNTDGRGFLASLQEEADFDPEGKQIMLLGAGGAARAVAQTLIQEKVDRIYLVNRTVEKAHQLVSLWEEIPGIQALVPMGFSDPLFPGRLQESHLLVNSTSVGLSGEDPFLFDYRLLPKDLVVCDLIYDPNPTPLLKAAQERGCPTLSGLGMLIYQGALSFEIWTGRPAPVKEMRRAVEMKCDNLLDRAGRANL